MLVDDREGSVRKIFRDLARIAARTRDGNRLACALLTRIA
jgi:hypothetical protein